MQRPTHKPYLDAIAPYVGGKTKAVGDKPVIKLSSNENPCGPSPVAIKAYESSAPKLTRYPADGAAELRAAISNYHGFAEDQLICGAGSDEVIGMIIKAYAGVGDEVLYPEHAFLMYRIYTQQVGATPVTAPESNLTTDVDALLSKVTDKTRIVFIANPNNPTGSYIPVTEVGRLRSGLRDDIILVIDGAYAEYMRDVADYTDGRMLVNDTNTIITKTFSKIYGLPALRIGYGYGPKDIIDVLYKVRSPFNVTQPALDAAKAALSDHGYMDAEVTRNNDERERVSSSVSAMGLQVSPSFANFILIHFPQEAAKSASAANAHLMAQGIIPREVANYGLPHCLRVSIGTYAENDAFLDALKEFISS